jgi:hypothetical protein
VRVTAQSTDEIVTVNGQQCRIWRARSARGIEFLMYVQRVRVGAEDKQEEFKRELVETPAPPDLGDGSRAIDGRLIF